MGCAGRADAPVRRCRATWRCRRPRDRDAGRDSSRQRAALLECPDREGSPTLADRRQRQSQSREIRAASACLPEMPSPYRKCRLDRCVFFLSCALEDQPQETLSTTKDTKVHEGRADHYVLTADSRIRRATFSSLTVSRAGTPKGKVMFPDVTCPDRTPKATGTPRSPTIR